MNISVYNPSNIEEIQRLFTITFSDSEGQSEGLVIGNLAYELMTKTDVDDFYCFVATDNDQIIGSIIFSRLFFENKVPAFLLSPVAIHPRFQAKGIGQKLINFSLDTLKKNGVELVFTYGDPRYYSKVGFNPISEKLVKAPLTMTYPEGWLGQSLVRDKIERISGKSRCVGALNNPEIW
jgi:putative acetyltransferase